MPAHSISFRSLGDQIEIEMHPASKTAVLDRHDELELYKWLYARHNTPTNAAHVVEFNGHPTFTKHS